MKNWMGLSRRTLFVAMMFAAMPVWADEPERDVIAAEKVYEEAKDYAEKGEWLAALGLFEKAYRLDPSPRRAAHLGRAQVMNDLYPQGATNLERYLREEKNAPSDVRAVVENLLRRAKTKVATVTLKLEQPGMTVRIDNLPVPEDRLLWPQYLKPGLHVFEASMEGFEPMTLQPELGEGKEEVVELGVAKRASGEDKPIVGPRKPVPDKRVVIAGGAASGAFVVTSLGLLIGSKVSNDEAVESANDANSPQYDASYSASGNLLTAATIVGVIGLAGGVATALYAFKGRGKLQPGVGAKTSLFVAPTFGGAVLHYTW